VAHVWDIYTGTSIAAARHRTVQLPPRPGRAAIASGILDAFREFLEFVDHAHTLSNLPCAPGDEPQ
jgi:hypothetical protein